MVLVPRHQERGKEVGEMLAKQDLNYIYRNQLSESLATPECGELDCLLVNTTGELRYFYREATVVFVGKSLTAKGGQNPIEPARLGCKIFHGPYVSNFNEIYEYLEKLGVSKKISDSEELSLSLVEEFKKN